MTRLALLIALIVLFRACSAPAETTGNPRPGRHAAAAPGSTDPHPPVEPGSAILRDLDALQARADRLLSARSLPGDAARAAVEACVVGVERLTVRRGEIEARCRRSPSVGVHPLSTLRKTGRAPAERGGSPSQDHHHEPGAAGQDSRDGLAASEAA